MIRFGTSYFVNFSSALRYYSGYRYEDVRQTVIRKLDEGEIHIGRPEHQADQRVYIDDDGRYVIVQYEGEE